MQPVRVSLVITVKNEAASLPALMDSIVAQERRPDEIIVCDGGSTDGTVDLLRCYESKVSGLRILVAPGANISQGRNLAIAAAKFPVIACTDAGVRLDPAWLYLLTSPFGLPGAPDVVGGFFVPDPRSIFELAMGAAVLPELKDLDPENFLPSSRSIAFRKSAWEAVGGYPEWLDYCEDLVFDLALKKAGFRFLVEPRALVYFRPRQDLTSYFLQYYRYARGDGKADLWRQRHAIRYITYLVLVPLLGIFAEKSPLTALVGLCLAALYLRRPLQRGWHQSAQLELHERLVVLGLIPLIRVVGDLAKMLGYPIGLLWRWKRQTT